MTSLNDILKKNYEVPKNISPKLLHKYVEVIDKGYAPFLEVLYNCGGFCTLTQFSKFILKTNRSITSEQGAKNKASKIAKSLSELGFIGYEFVNKNKLLYLKKPGKALVRGDYNIISSKSITKELKNKKLITSLLKFEFLLDTDNFLTSNNMLYQLIAITKGIYCLVEKYGNKYNYNLSLIKDIIRLTDYNSILRLLNEHPEYICRLGIIRDLWLNVGTLFRDMVPQNNTVMSKPRFYSARIYPYGEIIFHCIFDIIIFDIDKNEDYYTKKVRSLYYVFSHITDNELKDMQKVFTTTGSLGNTLQHHIGYSITLIGDNLDILNSHKKLLDSLFASSQYSPLLAKTNIIHYPLNINSSYKGNSITTKYEERLNKHVLEKLASLNKL